MQECADKQQDGSPMKQYVDVMLHDGSAAVEPTHVLREKDGLLFWKVGDEPKRVTDVKNVPARI
ncbi:MAG: hypothetical protein OXR66_04760 [Candidatus Woesearchaeota archaeon]|nr:hypothetical protein [Candidatus Woesearchaeota archaeon]